MSPKLVAECWGLRMPGSVAPPAGDGCWWRGGWATPPPAGRGCSPGDPAPDTAAAAALKRKSLSSELLAALPPGDRASPSPLLSAILFKTKGLMKAKIIEPVEDIGDFMQRHFPERPINANVTRSTVSMALANHEMPFDVRVHAAFSETSLHKVPTVDPRVGQICQLTIPRKIEQLCRQHNKTGEPKYFSVPEQVTGPLSALRVNQRQDSKTEIFRVHDSTTI